MELSTNEIVGFTILGLIMLFLILSKSASDEIARENGFGKL